MNKLSIALLASLTFAACNNSNKYDPVNRSGLRVKDTYLMAVIPASEMSTAVPATPDEVRSLYYFTAKGGALTAAKYGDTKFTHFTTDAQGNVTAATGNKGGITFSYTNGLITTATYYINGASKPQVTSYRYDAKKRIIEENTVFADRSTEALTRYKYGDDGGNNPVASYHYIGHEVDTVSHYWGKLKSPYSTLPPIVHYLHIDIPMGDCAVVAEVSTLTGNTKKISYLDRNNLIDHSYVNENNGSTNDSRWYTYNK